MADALSDGDLIALLREEEDAAVGYRDTGLADDQATALDFYNGEPFGDEEDGRSQFVTRDVAEVCDYMTVSVLRPFVSGDRVLEFEGDDKAKEVTAALNHLFMRKQAGYRLLHDWLKAGLIEKIAVVKTGAVTERQVKRETYQGATGDDLVRLEADGWTIVAATPMQSPDGAELFTVQVERTGDYVCFKDLPIPSEEFLFSDRTAHEDDAVYLAHRSAKTRSELRLMGFDGEVIDGLPVDDVTENDWRRINRFEDEGTRLSRSGADKASQTVTLLEEYIRVDRDGDGIAELLCVHRVGTTLLDVKEVEEQPFTVFCPFPLPYRLVGHSLADKVMDIQRLRSVATRQSLDAFYLSNAPRTLVHEDSISENTLDDLLTVRPGSIIRWKGPTPPQPYSQPFTAEGALRMLEFATGERESRTGITRLNQGLDADALNKTATGTAMMQAQGQQMEDYIARNFGEALARLFMKKLRLMAGRAEPFKVNMEGRQIEVNPKSWPAEMDLSVQVGLGTGRKDVRLAYRQQVIALQAQAVANMPGMVTPKQLFNSAQGLVADMNIGAATDYFTDPESPEAQAAAAQQGEKPDPEQQKMQAEMALKQADMQAKQQEAAMKLELAREEAGARLELDRQRAQMDAQMAEQAAQREYDLAVAKMQAEGQLAREKMALEAQLAQEQAELRATFDVAKADAGISSYRPGGELDQ